MNLAALSSASPLHTFHIPVMGIGFTLDTALRVAPLGIDSVISLVDDSLIEQVRRHYCRVEGLDEAPILGPDARARRITAYLDLVASLVAQRFARLRTSSFDDPDGIRRYFELLPTQHPLQKLYEYARHESDQHARLRAETLLRDAMRPGSIDVNIMTKLDRALDRKGQALPASQSEAVAALRGFAASRVQGSVVLSAGFNPRLCATLATLDAFWAREGGFDKKVILKVGNFRSAEVQATYLAKRGVWVSEFRVESGLNCGGHAFPTAGELMGPVLREFADRRCDLKRRLFAHYTRATAERGGWLPAEAPEQLLSAQGGVGRAEEHEFLRRVYGVDRVGWGSPFLLVPEVCRVDHETLNQLLDARPHDIALTRASPLGVRFWQLQLCASEQQRRRRVASERPGSSCPKGHLALARDPQGRPECPAARTYQRRKLAELRREETSTESQRIAAYERIVAPTCICHDLGGSLTKSLGIDTETQPCVCPGPNVVHFPGPMSLRELVDHIYGRAPLRLSGHRSHMFVSELALYVAYLNEQLALAQIDRCELDKKGSTTLIEGLRSAVAYYRALWSEHANVLPPEFPAQLAQLSRALDRASSEPTFEPAQGVDASDHQVDFPFVPDDAGRPSANPLSSGYLAENR